MKYFLILSFLILNVGCKDRADAFFDSVINSFKTIKVTKAKKEKIKVNKGLLIKNAKVFTIAGKTYEKASILIKDGKIDLISESEVKAGKDVQVIDAQGKQVTPGIIDVHSHMGVYPNPGLEAHSDGNEMVRKATADVSAQDGFWPQDPSIWRAIAGGITTIQVLPGSANLVGGTSFTARMIPGKVDPKDMRFPGAPVGMKMACGENPKRVYGKKGGPSTRMGNASEFRKLFQSAKEYAAKNKKTTKSSKGKDSSAISVKSKKGSKKKEDTSKRDFANENLAKVLSGEVLLHIHCYRADDISVMINIADEFGFQIKTFQHALEAYKLKDRLKEKNIGSATWADWWGFKAEAYDGIPHNIALLEDAGAKAIVHSDSSTDIRFLNVEAAKAWRSGLELGLDISEEQALSWITKNAAWALGIDDKVGSIEVGKFADLVIWDGHPLSAYTKTSHVIVDGKIIFDRSKNIRPESDFEIGYHDKKFLDGREFNSVKTKNIINKPSFETKWFKNEFDESNSFTITNIKFSPSDTTVKHVAVSNGVITKIYEKQREAFKGDVIDGEGKILTAGLIESASSLGLVEISAERAANDAYDMSASISPSLRSVDALNLDGPRIAINRKEGVTTAISNVSTSQLFGEAVAFDLIEDGDAFNDAPYLASALGKALYSETNTSRASIWRQLRRIARETAAGKNVDTNLLSENDYDVLKKYFTGKKPWLVSIDRSGDIKKLIRFKKEVERKYGFNPYFVIFGGSEAWKVSDLIVREEIPVIVKPTVQVPSSFEKIYARDDLSAFLISKGVEVLISSRDWDSNVRRLRQQAGFAIKYGLKWSDALDSITKVPARVLNLSDRGRIKAGSKANLVLWTGDLFEPFNTVQAVWIDGKRKTLNDRQRKLALKYLN